MMIFLIDFKQNDIHFNFPWEKTLKKINYKKKGILSDHLDLGPGRKRHKWSNSKYFLPFQMNFTVCFLCFSRPSSFSNLYNSAAILLAFNSNYEKVNYFGIQVSRHWERISQLLKTVGLGSLVEQLLPYHYCDLNWKFQYNGSLFGTSKALKKPI